MENTTTNKRRLKTTKKTIKKTKPKKFKMGQKAKPQIKTRTFFENAKMNRNGVKHVILKSYVDSWFPKMSRTFPQSDIVFVDGFSGIGKYDTTTTTANNENENSSYGSPLVVYEALHTHTNLDEEEKAKIFLIFVELKEKYAKKLEKNLTELKTRLNSKVNFFVIQNTFVNAIEGILNMFKHGPMFIFADPFGFNGDTLPMELMRKIISRDSRDSPTELLMSCMDGYANRWFKNRKHVKTLDKFIGQSDNWRSKISELKTSPERREKFISMYIDSLGQEMKNLKKPKNFYPLKFSIRNQMNRHIYHLLFITFHIGGIKEMKYSMNRISQVSNGQNIYSEFATSKSQPRDHLSEKKEIIPDIIRRLKEKAINEGCEGFEYGIFNGFQIERFIWIDTPYYFNFKDDFVAWFFGKVVKTQGTTFDFRIFHLNRAKYPEEYYKRGEKRLKAKEAKRLRENMGDSMSRWTNPILRRQHRPQQPQQQIPIDIDPPLEEIDNGIIQVITLE